MASELVRATGNLLNGHYPSSLSRNVDGEHLLRRRVVQIDLGAVAREVAAKPVLITGAGGSIGSELCRQLSRLQVSELIMVDRSEHHLYRLCLALREEGATSTLTPILGDIRAEQEMYDVLQKHHPYLVIHAAAYKHLPFMELFPREAVKNNIFGTRTLAKLCVAQMVPRFLMISTDKAVRPTSVMGATKRVAEMVVQGLGQHFPTKFMTVRFGNVLWSEGSVTVTFHERLARGLPLLVTDPKAERYFITILEAVQLSLLAGVLGNGGSIYFLRMGQPVRITDLARDLIRLARLQPEDIPIQYSGLRPGEKLSEDLLRDGEDVSHSVIHENILVAKSMPVEWPRLDADLDALFHVLVEAEADTVKRKLKELVPDYEPHLERVSVFNI